ncbi:MAG: peptidylprolyl isomerase [Bacteroidota bacterium]
MAIKKGDEVAVHYTGRFEDGQVFDSSIPRKEPLRFTVGAGQMIKGFDKAVEGMEVEEEKTVTLPPAEAYGEAKAENFVELPKTQFPPDLKPKVGDELTLSSQGGNFQVRVHELKEETVVLDANPPMAGKTLIFDIKIIEVNPKESPNFLPDW